MKNSDKSITGFARSAFGTVFTLATSAGLLFLNGLVLARLLGKEGFGAYTFADASIDVLVWFSMFGFDRITIRYVVEYYQKQDWGKLRGIVDFAFKRCLAFVAVIAPIVAILVTLATASQPEAFTIITTFWIAIFLLPLRVVLKLNQVTLQGLKRVVYAYMPDYVIRPALLLVLSILLIDTPQEAQLVHIIGAIVAVVISYVTLNKFMPAPAKTAEKEVDPTWLRTALPFMMISGLIMLNQRGGTTVVGLIADLETVALYGVAVRISGIVALALAAVNAVAAPRIAQLYMEEKFDALQRLVTWTTRGVSTIAFSVMVIFILFGSQILLLFGPDFDQAHTALLIFGVGELVNASTGVTIWLFMMTGREKIFLKILMLSTTIHYSLIIILSPIWGVEGAALATAIGTALTNTIMAVYAYRKLKINVTFI